MASPKTESYKRWQQSDRGKATLKAWRDENRERLTPRHREAKRRFRLNNPAGYFYNQLKTRAKQRGQDFNLTKEYLEEIITPMRCSVTGVDLVHTMNASPNCLSIDRVDSSKGYVKGNIRLVSWIYNRAKGDGTDEDVLKYLITPMSS